MFDNIALSVEATIESLPERQRTAGEVYRAYSKTLRVPAMCRIVEQPDANVIGVIAARDALPSITRIARIIGRFSGARFSTLCGVVNGAFVIDNLSASIFIGMPGAFRPHVAVTTSLSSVPVAVAIAAHLYDNVAFGVDETGSMIIGGVDDRRQWIGEALSPPTMRAVKVQRAMASLSEGMERIASFDVDDETSLERIARAWRAVDSGDRLVIRDIGNLVIVESRSREAERDDAVSITLRARNSGIHSLNETFVVNRVALFCGRSLHRWFGDRGAALFAGANQRALTIAYRINHDAFGGAAVVAAHFRHINIAGQRTNLPARAIVLPQ